MEKTKWGSWQDLYTDSGSRVKLLTVSAGHSLSMQHHLHRSELWLVVAGQCTVQSRDSQGAASEPIVLALHDHLHIPQGSWHKLANPYSEDCRLIELQWGSECRESDLVLCPIDQETRRLQYAENNQR